LSSFVLPSLDLGGCEAPLLTLARFAVGLSTARDKVRETIQADDLLAFAAN